MNLATPAMTRLIFWVDCTPEPRRHAVMIPEIPTTSPGGDPALLHEPDCFLRRVLRRWERSKQRTPGVTLRAACCDSSLSGCDVQPRHAKRVLVTPCLDGGEATTGTTSADFGSNLHIDLLSFVVVMYDGPCTRMRLIDDDCSRDRCGELRPARGLHRIFMSSSSRASHAAAPRIQMRLTTLRRS